jgi:hypothetical protein
VYISNVNTMGDDDKPLVVSTELPYCVYYHRHKGMVFYVGSGTRYRPFTPHGRSPKWRRFTALNPVYEIEIVRWFEAIDEAKRFEVEEIVRLQPQANSASRVLKTTRPPRASGPMEIKYCNACGEQWCFRGTGRPLRCGKCKSPYWDREKVAAIGLKNEGGGEKSVAAKSRAGSRSKGRTPVDGGAGSKTGRKVTGDAGAQSASKPEKWDGGDGSPPPLGSWITDPVPARKSAGCSECGSLGGMHQKGCKKA